MTRYSTSYLRLAGGVLGLTLAALGAAPAQAAYQPGEPVVTQGLACEQAMEVEAVVTLLGHGDDIPSALQQINHGAEKNRCFAGVILLTEYVAVAHTFHQKDNVYSVHKVKVVGVGKMTPLGVFAQPLAEPSIQFIVSAERAAGA